MGSPNSSYILRFILYSLARQLFVFGNRRAILLYKVGVQALACKRQAKAWTPTLRTSDPNAREEHQ
jgi:hypothetical protein